METVLHTIDLCDRLVVTRADRGETTLQVTGRDCPVDDSNLVLRAAHAFYRESGEEIPVNFLLEKVIPLGAGLGGGSSDGAAALLALNSLAVHPLETAAIQGLAAELGSDVPFFLTGGTAIGRGRGEQIEALTNVPPKGLTFLLWYPGKAISTASVYAGVNLDLKKPKNDLDQFIESLSQRRKQGVPEFWNALEGPFRQAHPELAALQDLVCTETGLAFSVTGSGSAMFAVVADRESGKKAENRLQAVAAGETFLCETLD